MITIVQEVLCITEVTLHLRSVIARSVSAAGRAGAYLRGSLPHLPSAMQICRVRQLVPYSKGPSEVSRVSQFPCSQRDAGWSSCMTSEN